MGNMSSPTGTQAVERAARLLTEIVDSGEAVSFSQLAQRTGLAKSTTSRLLLALERNQLVRREESGAYRPGELFMRHAWRSPGEAGLVALAQPVLEHLGELTGETINVGVVRGECVEQIAQVSSRYLLGATDWVGRPVPLHASALGKVLLAFGAAPLPGGKLERLTERTITHRSVLLSELEEVRRRGYAVTNEELEDGLVAVAAPLRGPGGRSLAALSVSAPVSRVGVRELPQVAAQCVIEAAELSRRLGHRSGTEGAA